MEDTEWKRLLRLLKDPGEDEDEEQEDAMERFIAINDPSRIPDLYILLQEENFWLRELAAEPLARLEGVRALPALLKAQHLGRQEGHDNDGLDPTLFGLITAHKQEAASLLRNIFFDPTSEQRSQAVWGLGFLPKDLALEPLLQALDDDVTTVRVEAARVLSARSFMSQETIVALLRALVDHVIEVRKAAAYSLGYLSCEDTAPTSLQNTLLGLCGEVGDAVRRGIESHRQLSL